MRKRKLPYKKMIQAIDKIVNNDWGYNMIDMKMNLHSENKYYTFTQEEAIQMSQALGRIYQIAHCVDCTCSPNLYDNNF